MAGLLTELKRRNVFRVAAAYAAVAWLSLELLSIVLPTFGAPDWALQAVVVVLAIGFVPVLMFAWAFEVTPGGIKREAQVERSDPDLRRARKLDLVVIAVLVAAIGVLALDRLVLDARVADPPAAGSAIDSIAVLPFEDFSAGGEYAYLGTGIADTILHSLAQIDGLKVAARTSSFQLAERDTDIAEIGVALGVGAVLEGSVQVVGNKLRIIAQLVRTSDQSHLWSKTFSGTTDDIFATQDTIAAAVAETLQGRDGATPAPQAATTPEVYALFLKGRELWQRRNPRDLADAVAALERAVELDPSYLPARAELVAARWFSYLYGDVEGEDARERIRTRVDAGIEHVLATDPTHAQTWSIRGLRLQADGDSAEAIAAFERALELNPNDARAMVWLSQELVTSGLYNESLGWTERAFQLDPMNTYVRGRYASALAQTGVPAARERAMEIVEETLRLDPAAYRGLEDAVSITAQAGDLVQAVRYAMRALELRPDTPSLYGQMALVFMLLGDVDTAARWGEQLSARFGNWLGSDWMLITGDFGGFVEWARRLQEEYPDNKAVRGNYAYAMLLVNHDGAGEVAETLVRDEAMLDASGRPTISDMNIVSLLAWWHQQRGHDERVAELRTHIASMYAQLEANGRPAGINGTLMEIGYWLVMEDEDRAYAALAKLDGQNEAYFYTLWRQFPAMRAFAQRADVQALFAKWAQEQAALRARLRDDAPAWLFEPARFGRGD